MYVKVIRFLKIFFHLNGEERSPFNRGMLMNIGFNEAQLLQEHFQCFIFHDVDLLPEYDGNPYTCPEDGKPRQMAFSINSWNYMSVIIIAYINLELIHSK